MVFSYPPVLSLLAEENGEVAWITSYAVDRFGTPALLVKDLVEDPQRCCFDIKVDLSQTAAAQIEFDAHIWGTRREDRHWLAGDNDLASKRWQIGSKQFFAPLYEWTRDEVIEALTIFEETAPAADTGNVTCCSRCLMKSETGQVFCPKAEKDIPVVEWDREENLKFVRTILRSNK